MAANDIKKIVVKMAEKLNKGDVEGCVAFTHPECKLDGKPYGREGDRIRMNMFKTAFPDQTWNPVRMIAEGEWVSTTFEFTGTFQDKFGDIPPTGKVVTFTGISLYRIVNDQFVEIWEYYDKLGLYQQLGLIPEMA